jgi:hypothetical protein
MKFQIDFNQRVNDKVLKEIGAKWEDMWKGEPGAYSIEINDISELEPLLKKVDLLMNDVYYSAIVSFDPPTIYLDNEI